MANIHAKVAQMLSDFLCFLKHNFQLNLELLLSGQHLEKIGLLFIPKFGYTEFDVLILQYCDAAETPF